MKEELKDFLKSIAETELRLELIRQKLCRVTEFDAYSIFQEISPFESKLSSVEISSFLNENGSNTEPSQIKETLIRNYDSDKDDMLSYKEYYKLLISFLKIIFPSESPKLRSKVALITPKNTKIPEQVIKLVARILELEIQLLSSFVKTKENYLASEREAMKFFFELSIEGKITLESLKIAMADEDSFSYDEEMIAIIRRFDKNHDGVISWEEFLFEFDISTSNSNPKANKSQLPENTGRLISFGQDELESSKRRNSNKSQLKINDPMENTLHPFKSHSETNLKSSPKSGSNTLKEIYLKKEGNPLSRSGSPFSHEKDLKDSRMSKNSENSKICKKLEKSQKESKDSSLMSKSRINQNSSQYESYVDSCNYYTPITSNLKEIEHKHILESTPHRDRSSHHNTSLTSKRSIRRKDALKDSLRKFIPLIKIMIDCENKIEKARQILALCPDFSVLDFYRELDQELDGKVTKSQFKGFLENYLRLNVRSNELELWFRKNLFTDHYYI